jgi:hypothetical protein
MNSNYFGQQSLKLYEQFNSSFVPNEKGITLDFKEACLLDTHA